MYLHKLEINGFKSFARKVTLEFDRGITAIVGPNGSGKSNVAESIRWVMGEQSAKQLRAKKGQDVIFSGSDKAASQGMSEVVMFFDNTDRGASVDYSEFSLSRKLYRDKHSEYLFNNQNSKLSDIQLLLAQANLSSKNYSVIGQGMVDGILNASPIERKEFFEEASGVRPLQIKKHLANLKLDRTQENISTINIQLDEIIPRLKLLTRQVNKLERRTEIEGRLRDSQYNYFGSSFYKLNLEQASFFEQEKKLKLQIDLLEGQVKGLQKVMSSLTKDSSHSDQFSETQNRYQSLVEEKSKLKEEELGLRSEILQAAKSSQQKQVPIGLVNSVVKHHCQISNNLRGLSEQLMQSKDFKSISTHFQELISLSVELDNMFVPLKPYLQDKDVSKHEDKLNELRSKIVEKDKSILGVQQIIKGLVGMEKEEKVKIWQTQNELQSKQQILSKLVYECNEVRVNIARVETRIIDLGVEVNQEVGQEFLVKVKGWQGGDERNLNKNTNNLREEIYRLRHELELIGGIDLEVQKEYLDTKERHNFLDKQLGDLKKSISQLQGVVRDLEETIKLRFSDSFRTINIEFQKYFKTLFRGGKAELRLIKGVLKAKQEGLLSGSENEGLVFEKKPSNNQFNKDEIIGVEISATPPGKKLKSINMLSGGERALTSIGLICAIISNNPAPFVVLDEVDAALDEENSARLGEIIEELSCKTQFVIITHNRATMEKATTLYGVTMGDDGISKLLSLKLESAEQYANR